MATSSDIGRFIQAVYKFGHWEQGFITDVTAEGTISINYGGDREDTIQSNSNCLLFHK